MGAHQMSERQVLDAVLAEAIRTVFEETDGVVDVDWEVEAEGPRIQIDIDREKAEQLDLPVDKKKGIDIKRTSNRIKVRVHYSIAIEFPGYTYVWDKEHYHERPLFYN